MKKKTVWIFVMLLLLLYAQIRNVSQVRADQYPSVIIDTDYATAGWYGLQDRMFYSDGRWWAFVSDGTDYVLKSSTNGIDWGNPVMIKDHSGNDEDGYHLDSYFDGAYIHYAYSYCYEGENITYRKGNPQSDGSVSWVAAEQVVFQNPDVNPKYPTVTVDSGGYPWITYLDIQDGTQYSYVTKSSTNDGTWTTASGFPYKLSYNSGLSYAHVVTLSDNRVCAFWSWSNQLVAKFWENGVWGSGQYITFDLASPEKYTAVVTDEIIHVVFLEYEPAETYPYNVAYTSRLWDTYFWTYTHIDEAATSTTTPLLSVTNASASHLVSFWTEDELVLYSPFSGIDGWMWDIPHIWFSDDNIYSDSILCSHQLYNDKVMFYHVNGTIFDAYILYRPYSYSGTPDYYEILVSEDSWIASSNPDYNYDSDPTLRINYPTSPVNSINKIYLKFSLESLPDTWTGSGIDNATLRLTTIGEVTGEPVIHVHFVTSDSWTESTITYNNAPPYDETSFYNVSIPEESGMNTHYYWDVTGLTVSEFEGDQTLSVALESHCPNIASFWHTKGAGLQYGAVLIINGPYSPSPGGPEPEPETEPGKGAINVYAFFDAIEVTAEGSIVETGLFFPIPAEGISLDPGSYTVRVVCRGQQQNYPVTVTEGETTTVNAYFTSPEEPEGPMFSLDLRPWVVRFAGGTLEMAGWGISLGAMMFTVFCGLMADRSGKHSFAMVFLLYFEGLLWVIFGYLPWTVYLIFAFIGVFAVASRIPDWLGGKD